MARSRLMLVARGSHAFYNFWTVNALNTGDR